MKNTMRFLLCILVFAVFSWNLSANSAKTEWNGTDSSGAQVLDEDCPVIVQHEDLTFDIRSFPGIGTNAGEATVEAAYTFHNPADYAVDARLAFPFGTLPEYPVFEADDMSYFGRVCKVLTDGKETDSELHFTFHPRGSSFSVEEDLPRLKEGYNEDGFWKRDQIVTKYTWHWDSVPDTDGVYKIGHITVSADPQKTRLLDGTNDGGSYENTKAELHFYYREHTTPVLYVAGEQPEFSDWTFRLSVGEGEPDCEISLQNTEVMTLEDYVLSQERPLQEISDSDWFNIMTAEFREMNDGTVMNPAYEYRVAAEDLLGWCVYSLHFEPGQTLLNSVTVPMYPAVETAYEPPLHTYTYLLTPASTWKSFGSLDIQINTPFEVYQKASALEKTDAGYHIHYDELPQKDFVFRLSESANPVKQMRSGDYLLMLIMIPPLLLLVLVILFVRFLLNKLFSRSRRSDA